MSSSGSLIFRAAVEADLPAIRALLQKVLARSANPPYLTPEQMKWKYWESRADWQEPRSYIIEHKGKIVAHVGIWPCRVMVRGAVRRAAHMIDWGADSAVPGSGVAAVERLKQLFDIVYSVGGPPTTRELLGMIGFRSVGSAWLARRPLRPWAMALNDDRRDWRLPARTLRNWWWSRAPSVDPGGWQLAVRATQGLPSGRLQPGDTEGAAVREREYFEYLSGCPAGRFSMFAMTNSTQVAGYMMLGVIQRQARIVWQNVPDNPDQLCAAYSLAARVARRDRRVLEIVALGCGDLSAAAVERAGWHVHQQKPIFVYQRDETDAHIADVQLGDYDGAFLDEGSCLTV